MIEFGQGEYVLINRISYTLFGVCSLASLVANAQGSTASYSVTFESIWSVSTHPQDFPADPHFSGLIGGTHNDSVSFWVPGQIASPGMENMAERGVKTSLEAEVDAAIIAGDAFSIISGGGIGLSPASVSKTFSMDSLFPLVSLVSMIAPSPDWFVGVHDLSMRPNGQWLEELIVDLFPYDAGTDDGITYTSLNSDTNPKVPIALLDGAPFARSHAPSMGTFTFTLLNTTEPPGTWVDFGFTGSENGSFDNPFNMLLEGLAAAAASTIVKIKGDTGTPISSETLTIDQAVTIEAVDGTIRIGDSGSRNAGTDLRSGFVSRK